MIDIDRTIMDNKFYVNCAYSAQGGGAIFIKGGARCPYSHNIMGGNTSNDITDETSPL